MTQKQITLSNLRLAEHLALTIIILFLIGLSSCTLHFKGKDIELDTESKVPTITNTPRNHTYELAQLDIFNNARVEIPTP